MVATAGVLKPLAPGLELGQLLIGRRPALNGSEHFDEAGNRRSLVAGNDRDQLLGVSHPGSLGHGCEGRVMAVSDRAALSRRVLALEVIDQPSGEF